jgi:hypothetical protein
MKLLTRRSLLPFAVAALGALAGVATTAAAAPTSSAVETSSLSAEDVLAATLRPADLKRFLPRGATWWPALPEFESASFDPAPGKRFWVVQSFDQVGRGKLAGPVVQAPLTLYATDADASADFAAVAKTRDASGKALTGPAVGDESRYFTRSAGKQVETALRFRVGAVVGRISGLDAHAWTPAALARLAGPVVARLHAVLAGSLTAAALPDALTRRLPPAFDDLPIAGTAAVPAEDWAVVDESGKPQQVRDFLRSHGAGSLAFRRYDVTSPPGQVIEITLFPFRDAASAETWVNRFLGGLGKARLDPGSTGLLAGFKGNGGKFYELQFAAGSDVADVSCFSPFGTTSAACEDRVRTLGELWYRILGGA